MILPGPGKPAAGTVLGRVRGPISIAVRFRFSTPTCSAAKSAIAGPGHPCRLRSPASAGDMMGALPGRLPPGIQSGRDAPAELPAPAAHGICPPPYEQGRGACAGSMFRPSCMVPPRPWRKWRKTVKFDSTPDRTQRHAFRRAQVTVFTVISWMPREDSNLD